MLYLTHISNFHYFAQNFGTFKGIKMCAFDFVLEAQAARS